MKITLLGTVAPVAVFFLLLPYVALADVTTAMELKAKIKAKEGLSDAEFNKFLPYIHPLVREPVGGGLVLAVPAELGNQELARLGLADVTAAPFSADPQGKQDATKAIQRAVNFARDHQMAAGCALSTWPMTRSPSRCRWRSTRNTSKAPR